MGMMRRMLPWHTLGKVVCIIGAKCIASAGCLHSLESEQICLDMAVVTIDGVDFF